MNGRKDELDLFDLSHYQVKHRNVIRDLSKTQMDHFFDNLNAYFEKATNDGINVIENNKTFTCVHSLGRLS